MRNNAFQGERVTIRFDGTLAAHSTTTSTNAGQYTIYDENGNVRTLQPYERLLLDAIKVDIAGASADVFLLTTPYTTNGEPPLNIQIWEWDASVGASTVSTVSPTEETASFEGRALPLGVTPYLFSKSAVTVANLVSQGDARIVATTQPGRPTWREIMTPGGNF